MHQHLLTQPIKEYFVAQAAKMVYGVPGQSADELNRLLVKFLPEADSEFALYPMKRARWLEPSETFGASDDPKPCFVAASQRRASISDPDDDSSAIYNDYVWCKNGPLGPGYYSLLTKVAHVRLYTLINRKPATGPLGVNWTAEQRQTYQEWEDVKKLCFNRYKCHKPNDILAVQSGINDVAGVGSGGCN